VTLRSLVKGTIHRGLDLSARITTHLPRRPAARLLTYHEVLAVPGKCPNPYNQVSVQRLAQQIDRLRESGYLFLTATDLARSLAGPDPGGRRLLSLTFDDGLQEHATLALPLLMDRKIPATFYIVTGRIGTRRGGGRRPERYLNEQEIRDLSSAGMEIGSHGHSHRALRGLDPEELHSEVAGSRDRLRQILGHPPLSFAYPYGSRDTYDGKAIDAIREAGYTNAVCTVVGANRSGASPFELRRIPVYDTDGPELALARARGAYDWIGRLQETWLAAFPHHSTKGAAG